MPARQYISVIAVYLMATAGGCSDSGCASEHSRTWLYTGETMELKPEDGPFTASQLLQVAYQYHPMTEAVRLETLEERDEYMRSTPQWQALKAAHAAGIANRGPWRALVRRIADAYPGHYVLDTTKSYALQPSYGLEIGASPSASRDERGAADGQSGSIHPTRHARAMVSFLAPVYCILELDKRPDEDSNNPSPVQTPMSREVAPIVADVEREILTLFPGYHRIDETLGMTIAHRIVVGSGWYGDTTLIDALFATDWR